MKAVVDTNVFISGIFWKGPPSKVLEAWSRGRFRLVLSPEIFTEYQRVTEDLGRKYPEVDAGKILDLVGYHAEVVPDLKFTKPICSDPDDDKFLAAALSAKASFIVTGDKALLKIAEFDSAKIIQPSAFLKVIR
jgi:putative PIN family toxin of toxin-antitoxin system